MALLEWFGFSVGLVVVVTLIYLFVLRKSPPPEGVTMAKLGQPNNVVLSQASAYDMLTQAESYLAANNLKGAVECSAMAVASALKSLLAPQLGAETESLGIADAAFIVQSKGSTTADIVQPIYQLNNLRLQTVRGQTVSQAEAAWAVNFAKWLFQAIRSNVIKV